MIHFHGGLVNQEAGLAIAERLGQIYQQAGAFPLSVVWQSGLGETITGAVGKVGEEPLFKRLLARIVQFTAARAGWGGEGKRGFPAPPKLNAVYEMLFADTTAEPFAEFDGRLGPLSAIELQELSALLRTDRVIHEESARIAAAARVVQPPKAQTSEGGSEPTLSAIPGHELEPAPGLLAELATAYRDGERSALATALLIKRAVDAAGRVAARISSGRGHGLHATAVEELLRTLFLARAGAGVWLRMKQDALDAFDSDEACGGSALVAELAELSFPDPPVLVGHSTGAIWICRLLAHSEKQLPADRRFDVALLAPACDFRLLDRTLADHGHRVRRLRIFAMHDRLERADRLIAGVYPSSLLYLVSGVLEEQADWPLVGMQRFHTDRAPFTAERFPEIARARRAIGATPGGCVWSVADGGPGLSSRASRHGDFDDDPATLASVAHMIGAP